MPEFEDCYPVEWARAKTNNKTQHTHTHHIHNTQHTTDTPPEAPPETREIANTPNGQTINVGVQLYLALREQLTTR